MEPIYVKNVLNGQEELTPILFQQTNYKSTELIQEKSEVKERKFLVEILVILFGIGAWAGVSGVAIQLPLLVQELPEGWKLPSYTSVFIELANIGPVCYWVFRKPIEKYHLDKVIIYCLLGLGCITTFLLAFLYRITTIVDGEEMSLTFLILCFFTALVACTSSVLFLPYIRHFKEIYLTSYLIGEGLSGVLTSILAMFQNERGDPVCFTKELEDGSITNLVIYSEAKFSSQYFFLFMSAISISGLLSFYYLNNSTYCQTEHVTDYLKKENDLNVDLTISKCEMRNISVIRYFFLLILMSAAFGITHGLLGGVKSYSCLPYGNSIYYLSVVLGRFANPIASFLGLFFLKTSNTAVSLLALIYGLLASYLFATAMLSPNPPLVGTNAGNILIIFCWLLVIGFTSYIKLTIATIFRTVGGSAMLHCGTACQFGAVVSSATAFALVNFTNIFHQRDPCS